MSEDGNKAKKLYRNKAYFTRGHNYWTSYFLSIINFITIIYVLLGTQYPILYTIFPNILSFGVVFGIGYFTLANLIGRFDIKRGPLAVEQTFAFEQNPPFQELVTIIKRLDERTTRIEEFLLNKTMKEEMIESVDEIVKTLNGEE